MKKVEPDKMLSELIAMTRELGEPARDYVIQGEGNTSARIDENTFWIKASGADPGHANAQSFLRVRLSDVLEIVDQPAVTEQEVRARLAAAKLDPDVPGTPSIETATHALCLSLGEAIFVGHTHPTPLNAILCARDAEAAFVGSAYGHETLVCGKPLFVPYAPIGQPLARVVREGLHAYKDQHGQPPRVILLQNHGLVALGRTPDEVLYITALMVKTARILLGTRAWGGPHFIE
ncbi:MAG: class II aldolase/adducin family protein [Anaerolineae bacterium]|nr:class II aldolase/adducin family protein [Anaerolineae bacterium]